MKKFLWIFSSALLLSLAFLSTGCGDDGTSVNDLAPIVAITDGPTPSSVVAGAGSTVTVTVEATKGTKELESLSFLQGSDNVTVGDVTVNGVAAISEVHAILTPTDVMTFEITINVTADAGDVPYTIVVKDKGGLTDEVTFDVTVEAALEATIQGVDINLWNAAGPAGKGAIDLDNGGSTGTSDGNAELRDMGIDSLAGSGNNWRRRIGGINGTTVRYAGNIGVDFGAVASKEAIVALYNDAAELTTASTISDGNIDVWGDFKVSDTVNVGDVFVVYKSSSATYYLVVVNSVTENTTLGDNTDKYNVSIKY